MRKQFVKTVEKLMDQDPSIVTLLGDIGIYGFREVFKKYPEKIYNIGILEQSTVSVMSGLSMVGFIPIFHTIAPFMVERALEQIKLDIIYQDVIAQFVSVGGSDDYPALGYSHQSPGDIQCLLSIPNFHIRVPGSPKEFDEMFSKYYNKHSCYYRLSEEGHGFDLDLSTNLIRQTITKTAILVVGPLLKNVMEATSDFSNVDVIYCNTIRPFSSLNTEKCYDNIIVVSPFYQGTMAGLITEKLEGKKYRLYDLSIPQPMGQYEEQYGTKDQHMKYNGLDVKYLHDEIQYLI